MSNDEQLGNDAREENMAEQPVASAPENAPNGEPSPKRRVTRAWVIVCIVVGVIIIAASGFWIWHEQPSFCNAICHSPMDYYVNTYDDRDPSMGITAHANAGKSCLDCHTAEITTQVSEVMAWVSDNYPMDQNGVMLATGKEFATEEFCARAGCHTDANNMAEVVASTWGFEGNDEKYNPHASHQQFALECNDCHGVHEANVLVCNQCHNLNMPEGWSTPNDVMQAQAKAESEAANFSNPEATVQSPGYTSNADGTEPSESTEAGQAEEAAESTSQTAQAA